VLRLTILLFASAFWTFCSAQSGTWLSVPQNNEINLVLLEADSNRAPVLEVRDSLNRLHPGVAPEPPSHLARRYKIYGLIPGMRYSYTLVREQQAIHSGEFKNPSGGMLSFSFVAGACSFLPENPVYTILPTFNPLFYLNLGDLHYGDVKSDRPEAHQLMHLYRVLSRVKEASFLSRTPLMYTWDDHDFCGNNTGGATPCGLAAREAFKSGGPHIGLGSVKNGIHQAYTFGRIRFVLPDLRSARTDTSLLDKKSWKWLTNTLDKAVQLNQVVFLISSVPWMGDDSDSWGLNPAERERLADYLALNLSKRILILAGDAHMSGADRGENSRYSRISENPGPPVAQLAALIGFGSFKGGTYSEGGAFLNPLGAMQYANIKVIDGGENALLVNIAVYRKFSNQHSPLTLINVVLPFRLTGNNLSDAGLSELSYPIRYSCYSKEGKLVANGFWQTAPEALPANWRNRRYFLHLNNRKKDWVYAL